MYDDGTLMDAKLLEQVAEHAARLAALVRADERGLWSWNEMALRRGEKLRAAVAALRLTPVTG